MKFNVDLKHSNPIPNSICESCFKDLRFTVGTAGIILQAPSLYDLRPAIDEMLSEIEAVARPVENTGPML